MGHRAKHRQAALQRRVAAGRTIKSDLNPDGSQNAAYKALKSKLGRQKKKRPGTSIRDLLPPVDA